MDWYDENDGWSRAMRSYLNDGPVVRQTELLDAFTRNLDRRGEFHRNDSDRVYYADRLRFLTELLIAEQDGSSVPTLTQRVATLAEGGLTFRQALEVFAARQGEEHADAIAQARYLHVDHSDGEVEIDETPVCAVGENGTWVSAWVLVPASEQESADDGQDDEEGDEDEEDEEDV